MSKKINIFFVSATVVFLSLPIFAFASTTQWTAGGNSHGIVSVFTAQSDKDKYNPGETIVITANANSEDQSFGANTRGTNAISDFLFGSSGGTNRQGVAVYVYDFSRQLIASCGNGMVTTYVLEGAGDSAVYVATLVPEFTTNCTATASLTAPTTP